MKFQPVTVPAIKARKNSGKKITALTAYDFSFAKLLDTTAIDILLVGDSLGMVSQGHENTLSVTLEDVLYHTRSVKRGAHRALVVADMPFMSYQVSVEQAVTNAGRLIQEGHAAAVKLEGGARMADRVNAIVQAGIPVMGHIGLTPQSVHQFGGYKIQGKTFLDSKQIKQDAKDLQKAGAFSLVLEGIPEDLASEITKLMSKSQGIKSKLFLSGLTGLNIGSAHCGKKSTLFLLMPFSTIELINPLEDTNILSEFI